MSHLVPRDNGGANEFSNAATVDGGRVAGQFSGELSDGGSVVDELEDDDVPARVFEGMFVGGELLPDVQLAAALKGIGYDPDAPRKSYSARVWRAALEVARQHVYPMRPEAEGFRALGRRFADGFGKTIVGKVFRSVAPLFGVDRTFLSVPRYLHAVRRKMDLEMHAVGLNHYRLTASDPHPNPEFIAGCMLGILDVFSIEGRARVLVSEPERFELEFSWD